MTDLPLNECNAVYTFGVFIPNPPKILPSTGTDLARNTTAAAETKSAELTTQTQSTEAGTRNPDEASGATFAAGENSQNYSASDSDLRRARQQDQERTPEEQVDTSKG
ncbi:MAG: hypothetical protein M1824_002820 [Vezdaea acicularis]|nr:MAG: hypothetical protein M1824_002820 [Vezdaea acicularis]